MRNRLFTLTDRAQAFAIDAVFPKRCAVCGFRGSWVCHQCLAETRLFDPPWCPRCGIPVSGRCRCSFVPDFIERLRSAGPYDGWLRESVHLVKYQGESSRADHLAALLAPVLVDLGHVDALVAVPLHRHRLRERGFNQAGHIAEALAKIAGIPVWDALSRIRDTPHQVGLSADQRAENIHGAFRFRETPSMKPARVVLVDDVFTTGATLRECAAVLEAAGVSSISALTVC